MKTLWKIFLSLVGLALICGNPAQAQEVTEAPEASPAAPATAHDLTDTLARIKKDGQIRVGHRESPPFSYYDHVMNVVGYSQDYSNLIVEAVKKETGLSDLAVTMVPLNSSNRIPLLQNGSYDFECGTTTNNLERQKHLAFSNTIFIVGTRLLTRRDSGINDFDDLKGKKVIVIKGTTSEELLAEMNARKNMGIEIIATSDEGGDLYQMRMVESGEAAAFFYDDAVMAGERVMANNPGDLVIVGTPQSFEAYGCMFRKGDARFKKVLDEAIAQAQTSGAALESYNKWFMNPIPPDNVNLEYPLSDPMRDIFANPNDKAFQ